MSKCLECGREHIPDNFTLHTTSGSYCNPCGSKKTREFWVGYNAGKEYTASQMQDFLEKSLESKNRFEGDLEDCLHNGSWGDGCWVVDVDGDKSYIKCGDCNKIFDSGSELSLDVIKKIRDELKKKYGVEK